MCGLYSEDCDEDCDDAVSKRKIPGSASLEVALRLILLHML